MSESTETVSKLNLQVDPNKHITEQLAVPVCVLITELVAATLDYLEKKKTHFWTLLSLKKKTHPGWEIKF